MSTKTILCTKAVLATALMFVSGGAFATDRYVSSDRSYGTGIVDESFRYDDLQTAIEAAESGETVWVKDGFVCETGGRGGVGGQYDNKSTSNRVLIAKSIVVRSESGCVDEKMGKGATIRGAYGSSSSKLANDSVRAAGVTSGGKLVGFVLEGGSSKDGGSGGCLFLVDSTAEKCIVRNSYAVNGGGSYLSGSAARIVDCVISNNVSAGGNGGGVFQGRCEGCTISGNTAAGGGGCFKVDATNCTISANVSNGTVWYYGGGGGLGGKYEDCRILDNRASNNGGGLLGTSNTKYYGRDTSDEYVLAYKCLISCNSATHGGGMYNGTLSGGTVSNNAANASTGVGGGLWNVKAERVTICDNKAANSAGASGNRLTDCTLSGNVASGTGGGAGGAILLRCVVTNNIASYRGGGTSEGTNINCRIVCNRRITTAANGGGAASWNGAHYNCLIQDNEATMGAAGFQFWDCKYAEIVNCTFVDNTSADGVGAFYCGSLRVSVVNSISWNNTGTSKNLCGYATNCCFEANSTTVQWAKDNVITTDPRLVSEANGAVYPKARACRNAGVVFPWMSDAADPRSRDLVGAPRLVRERPSFGCCENPVAGLMLLVR